MTDNKQTYRIPANNLPGLKEKFEKLNKRIEKMNKKGEQIKPAVLNVGPAIIEQRTRINAIGEPVNYEVIFFDVTVEAEPVRMNGWDFIATIQHEDGGNIIRPVPGMVAEGELVQYREGAPKCNHCGYERRRNDTFVVRKVVAA